MAAVAASKPSPHRHRSSSDPFSDPVPYNTSPTKSSASRPAPTSTPKSPTSVKIMAATPASKVKRDDIAETGRASTDGSPQRTRMGRSQTSTQAPPRPTHAGRRSQSQDSVIQAAAQLEKAKIGGGKSRKKGSMHADVIDRMDFTGMGPMFHHDGPFDACAPSRNRHRTKAPMLAWAGDPSEAPKASNSESPYPSPDLYRNQSGYDTTYDGPKKKVDAIAEAWGIHEPEPFEDFSAGGGSRLEGGDTPNSSVYNGKDSHNSRSKRNTKDAREMREAYREQLEEGARRRNGNRRSALPPPQPIFAVENEIEPAPISTSPGSPGAPKRSKSLMHRIRKMRDNPNVPAGYDNEEDGNGSASEASRPTHRPQNSLMGRFNGNGGVGSRTKDNVSPISDGSDNYVQVGVPDKDFKDLPATPGSAGGKTPPAENSDGYFDSDLAGSPGGGLNRKTSLMRKFKGAVKGGRK